MLGRTIELVYMSADIVEAKYFYILQIFETSDVLGGNSICNVAFTGFKCNSTRGCVVYDLNDKVVGTDQYRLLIRW